MADDADSKSVGGNTVWVQVPPPALSGKIWSRYVLQIFSFCPDLLPGKTF